MMIFFIYISINIYVDNNIFSCFFPPMKQGLSSGNIFSVQHSLQRSPNSRVGSSLRSSFLHFLVHYLHFSTQGQRHLPSPSGFLSNGQCKEGFVATKVGKLVVNFFLFQRKINFFWFLVPRLLFTQYVSTVGGAKEP